jgi:hypothetical protein
MKIGPWRLTLDRHVIPHLPGQWRVSRSGVLVREPTDWLLCGVAPWHGSVAGADVLVDPLLIPRDYLVINLSHRLGRGGDGWRRLADPPRTAAECEPYGAALLELITEEALPFLDQHGSLDGYLAYLQGRADGAVDRGSPAWIDIHVDEELFCLYVLRGDRDGALRAAEWAGLAAAADDRKPAWVAQVLDRVRETAAIAERDMTEAVELLRDRVAKKRVALGIGEA